MVSPYSLSIPGGVQAQVLGLSRELRRMGIEVRVLGPCDGPPPATFVTPLGNSLPLAANGSVAPLAPDPSCALRTMRVLFEEQFDVLHIHEPFAPGPPMTTILLHPAPVIATFHAAGESASYRYLKHQIKPAAVNIVRNVAVSKDAAALVNSYIPADYEILFNGVDLAAYRQASPWPTDGPTIFFCGRHEERKGLVVLIESMSQLGPEVTLWVGSSGPDTERLREQTKDDERIVWLGRIDDAEKISRLKGAHVFCAPSLRGESFGVVLIEAMAAGTCIVASSLDGYRNVATDGVDALLVEPGEAGLLAAALRTALTDAALVALLTAAGDRRADDFSMTTLAECYAAMYRELAEPPTRAQRSVSPWPFMSRSLLSRSASPRLRRRTRMMTP